MSLVAQVAGFDTGSRLIKGIAPSRINWLGFFKQGGVVCLPNRARNELRHSH